MTRGPGRVDYDIVVTLAANAPVGPIREQLIVITDDQNSPQVPLLVEATVEADVMVTPSVVSLGVMKPGEAKQFNVVIKGKQPFQIDKIECDSETGIFKVRLPPLLKSLGTSLKSSRSRLMAGLNRSRLRRWARFLSQ